MRGTDGGRRRNSFAPSEVPVSCCCSDPLRSLSLSSLVRRPCIPRRRFSFNLVSDIFLPFLSPASLITLTLSPAAPAAAAAAAAAVVAVVQRPPLEREIGNEIGSTSCT